MAEGAAPGLDGALVDRGSPDEPTALAALFAQIARRLMFRGGPQETAQGVVEAAVALIGGCDHAGVMTIERGSEVASPAVTSELVVRFDQAQAAAGEGPCLSAMRSGQRVVHVDDLATDERWPRFGAAAVGLGVRSMLSCDLAAGRSRNAALNLYAAVPNAFDETSISLGEIFAVHASMALARAELEDQLRAAIDGRTVIGQAIGILMERHRVTAAQGFEMLKVASQNSNIRLRTLADMVVATGADPADLVAGG